MHCHLTAPLRHLVVPLLFPPLPDTCLALPAWAVVCVFPVPLRPFICDERATEAPLMHTLYLGHALMTLYCLVRTDSPWIPRGGDSGSPLFANDCPCGLYISLPLLSLLSFLLVPRHRFNRSSCSPLLYTALHVLRLVLSRPRDLHPRGLYLHRRQFYHIHPRFFDSGE